MLPVLILVLVAAIIAHQLDRRRNPRRDPGFQRAGQDDAQGATDAGNSAINKATWLRPGGF